MIPSVPIRLALERYLLAVTSCRASSQRDRWFQKGHEKLHRTWRPL